MFGIGLPVVSTQAVGTVGAVLAEAIALYVGYGVLTRATRSRVFGVIRGE